MGKSKKICTLPYKRRFNQMSLLFIFLNLRKLKIMFRLILTSLVLAMALECTTGKGQDTDSGAKGPASIRQRLGLLGRSKKEAFCGLTSWSGHKCDTTTNYNYGCDRPVNFKMKSWCWRSCDKLSECDEESKEAKWCWARGYRKIQCGQEWKQEMRKNEEEECRPHAVAGGANHMEKIRSSSPTTVFLQIMGIFCASCEVSFKFSPVTGNLSLLMILW